MNQKIIHGLNKHFWRRDIFGLVSYPVSFDGRTADASIIREQFGKEGGDDSDGLLYATLLKAQSKFNPDEDSFTGLLDKGLRLIIVFYKKSYRSYRLNDDFISTKFFSKSFAKHFSDE